MKLVIRFISLILIFVSCDTQKKLFDIKIDNLRYINAMPYIPELSGDSLFWVVVKEKKAIVPYLINKLSDTTKTAATVPNFGGYYTVSDIAYKAINEIIPDIPTLELAEDSNNPEPRDGYSGYWNYTRRSYTNRLNFQSNVRQWYNKNKSNLKWIKYTEKFRTAPDWKFKTSQHPAGGYYISSLRNEG